MASRTTVYRLEMDAPDDISRLQELVEAGAVHLGDIVAIICKTEGNGRMNDFTRAFATTTFERYLSEGLNVTPEDVAGHIALVMSGGCEGIMTPHMTIFVRSTAPSSETPSNKRLTVGVGFTRDLEPEEIGRMAQVRLVAEATRRAAEDAGITSPDDVHYVQTKGPLLTQERIDDALAQGRTVVIADTYKSMGYSNGASALGVGLALGEIKIHALSDEVIGRDGALFSSVASCSAGTELMNCQVVVIGNTLDSVSDSVAGHAILEDLLDLNGVLAGLASAGISLNGYPTAQDLGCVQAVFVKALTAQSGQLRGYRTTLLTDLDVGTRPVRGAINGMVASVLGDPMVYVSAGWGFHQGPLGGGVVAVIARAEDANNPN